MKVSEIEKISEQILDNTTRGGINKIWVPSQLAEETAAMLINRDRDEIYRRLDERRQSQIDEENNKKRFKRIIKELKKNSQLFD